jgi:tetratricopeptide (TPR) repeat protein
VRPAFHHREPIPSQLAQAAVLVSVLLGCASLPPPPSQGGPRWRELHSEHFVLQTDLEAEAARKLSRDLEQLLSAYLTLGWKASGELPLKLNVVVFAEREDFDHFARPGVAGYYLPDAMFEPYVVLAGGGAERLTVLKHELNHHIAYQAIQNQPRWFAEGIASYFETAILSDDGRFTVGPASQSALLALQFYRPRSAEDLLSDDGSDRSPRSEAVFYASSWLLVHYLMSERGPAFSEFQAALARGEEPARAWSATFPDLTPEQLDTLLLDYWRKGAYASYSLGVETTPTVSRERVMTDADVYALRAVLHGSCALCPPNARAQARKEIELALRTDPQHVRAGVARLLFLTPKEQAVAAARQFVAYHPEHWLGWLMLALTQFRDGALVPSEEGRAAAQRVAALAPTQPYAFMLLALLALESNQPDDALRYSERALRLQPTNLRMLAARALVLKKLGRCDALHELLKTFTNITHVDRRAELRNFERCP